MQDLTRTLFKPYTLVLIRLEGGEIIQGTVARTDDQSIRVIKADGTEVTVDRELLSRSEYCYTGFPTFQEREVPMTVRGNGAIYALQTGGMGVGRAIVNQSSLLDPALKEQAKEGSIVGVDVLHVVPKKGNTDTANVAAVIKAGALDDVLDMISALARQGMIMLARDFCELVLEQYPEDEDVLSFSLALEEAVERIKGVDFYSDLPYVDDDMLEPYGRIYKVDGDEAFIIDTASHKELFCHKDQQFLGELRSMSENELIGMPVVYSVKKNEGRDGYQARTVMLPMTAEQAGKLAYDLYYNQIGRKITACDVLRLIIEQFDMPYYQKQFNAWSNNQAVHGRLWESVVLDRYAGSALSLYLPMRETGESLTLVRKAAHMEKVSNLTGTPEVPYILSQKEMAEMKAALTKAAELSATQEAEDLEEQRQMAPQKEEEAIVLPDLSNCPNANDMVPPKATITVKYRSGSLFVEGENRPFSFKLDDIIDDALWSRADLYSTKFIQNEPVVCQLWPAEHRATHICPPQSVLSMLTAAKKAIMEAREKDPEQDRDLIFKLYDKADGYASHVLDLIPEHRVAAIFKRVTEDALKQYSDSCYKAPSNAVKACGTILSLTKNKRAYWVSDPLFSSPIVLPFANIIDKDYHRRRVGDELVYAVYPGTNGVPVARFACLARTPLDLVEMAEKWEKEDAFGNAWGIAMNILDAFPNHPDALAIVGRCLPKVDVDTVNQRQILLREDLFAQGQIAIAEERYRDAIGLFTRIIDSPDENLVLKDQSILRILHIYNVLLSENPQNEELKSEYRRAGEKYALGRHDAVYSLDIKKMQSVEALIHFYEDMEDNMGLIDAYRRRLPLLTEGTGGEIRESERISLIAETNAYIAWYCLLADQRVDLAGKFASRAKNKDNELGRICEAIVLLRLGEGEKEVREKGKFLRQNIDTLEESYAAAAAAKVYSGEGGMKNLTHERFALLCAIVQEKRYPTGDKALYHWLGRYLATLTCNNEAEYLEYFASTRSVPDDCNFVRQVFKCLLNGSVWRQWMDVRLICMLSQDAAYKLCSVLYDLDAKTFVDVLIRSGIETRPNPERPYFARQFAQWRGAAFQAQYVSYLKKVDALETEGTLEMFIEFFKDLEYESWMIRDDLELINEFHWQLPLLLSRFNAAVNSRSIKTTSRTIEGSINKWRDLIKDRPTVLMQCAFERLLLLVRNVVTSIENTHHFSIPVPEAKLLTSSGLDDEGSMYVEVEIRNKDKNAEPMLDCKLRLEATDTVIPDLMNPVATYSETDRVYGDESIIYILHFRLNPEADPEDHRIRLHFSYMVKAEPKTEDFVIPFKPLKRFKRIINDFNVGGVEKERFYGREALIENAVHALSKETSVPPHYFIYGQKRSGKSSVMLQIENRIREKIPSAIIVEIDFSEKTILKEENVYYCIFAQICQTIVNMNDELRKEEMFVDDGILALPDDLSMTSETFVYRLTRLKSAMGKNPHWADRKLILFIDEFTCAYTWLKTGCIYKEFVFRWKGLQKRGLFSAVLIGQDVLHAFIRECSSENAFEVLEKERLTYLKPEEARRMIIDRIKEVTGKDEKDVFIGNAIPRILYYSASSAFYTKWICQRLVDLLNARQLNRVTEADVDAAVWEMLENISEKDKEEKFDALLLPGIKGETLFSKERTMAVLDYVVDEEMQNPFRGCAKATLLARSGEKEAIIQDLLERGVILDPGKKGYYFIQVKLYAIWYKVRQNLKK